MNVRCPLCDECRADYHTVISHIYLCHLPSKGKWYKQCLCENKSDLNTLFVVGSPEEFLKHMAVSHDRQIDWMLQAYHEYLLGVDVASLP